MIDGTHTGIRMHGHTHVHTGTSLHTGRTRPSHKGESTASHNANLHLGNLLRFNRYLSDLLRTNLYLGDLYRSNLYVSDLLCCYRYRYLYAEP